MNRFMGRYLSPSLAISITALIVALGGAGYSATGGNFILGRSNVAITSSALTAHLNGRTLQLQNSNTGAAATPLALFAAAGHPPLTVNSATKVANLNADKLDGFDSTQFANKLVIPFNLAPGAITAQIVPPLNQPVFIMGVTSNANLSVGHVTLLRGLNSLGLWWVGLDSRVPAAITSNASSTPGDHIVYIEGNHQVDIEVNGPNTIRVHNESAQTVHGVVTLIW